MTNQLQTVSIPKPDDWHLHLRDGAMLKAVLPYTAKQFARAIVMPNLKPAITTTQAALAYRDRITAALPEHMTFTPLMALYLTDNTDLNDMTRGFEDGILFAAKFYPAGATTNSDSGITDAQALWPILDRLQRIGMPLLIHGEVTDPHVDFFDREEAFIEHLLIPIRRSFPDLKIVMEHVTTKAAVQYIMTEAQYGKIAATITAHHLFINRNAMFENGFNPHHFCLPVVKRESDRQAVVQAATSGAPMFFAGTDSAPHPKTAKECAKGAGGIFSAPNALAVYTQVFEEAGALGHLGDFLSLNGPAFYDLPVNAATLTMERVEAAIEPLKPILTEDGAEIVPFPSQTPLRWRIQEHV